MKQVVTVLGLILVLIVMGASAYLSYQFTMDLKAKYAITNEKIQKLIDLAEKEAKLLDALIVRKEQERQKLGEQIQAFGAQ